MKNAVAATLACRRAELARLLLLSLVIPAKAGIAVAFAFAFARHSRERGNPWTLPCSRVEAKAFRAFARVTFFARAKKVTKESTPFLAPAALRRVRGAGGNFSEAASCGSEKRRTSMCAALRVFPPPPPLRTGLKRQQRKQKLGPLIAETLR